FFRIPTNRTCERCRFAWRAVLFQGARSYATRSPWYVSPTPARARRRSRGTRRDSTRGPVRGRRTVRAAARTSKGPLRRAALFHGKYSKGWSSVCALLEARLDASDKAVEGECFVGRVPEIDEVVRLDRVDPLVGLHDVIPRAEQVAAR